MHCGVTGGGVLKGIIGVPFGDPGGGFLGVQVGGFLGVQVGDLGRSERGNKAGWKGVTTEV